MLQSPLPFGMNPDQDEIVDLRSSLDAYGVHQSHRHQIKGTDTATTELSLPIENQRENEFRTTFRVNSMNMKDGETGQLLWHEDYIVQDFWGVEETVIMIPKVILTKSIISREINFSSEKEMSDLRLVQNVFLNDQQIEEWKFNFGFLIPDSTNSWQQTIKSAPNVIGAEILSGNIVIETSFYDGENVMTTNKMRVYYI